MQPAEPGIYSITNTVNRKVYIGSSISVSIRMRQHRWSLIRGDHPNRRLQNAWNKYGEEVFAFDKVETCEASALLEREQWWIEHLRSSGENGYNLVHAERSDLPSENMSEIHKDYWQSLSEAEKADRINHLIKPENRKGNSERQLQRWKDPEFRERRLKGLEIGRKKTNASKNPVILANLAAGRAKAVAQWKTNSELKSRQRENNIAQWNDPVIREARLKALAIGREKTNAKKKADAAARRAARNDIV